MNERFKNLLHKYNHAWTFLYILIYMPWFIHLEKTITGSYHIMHTPIDDLIPFCEYFVIPYFFWFIYISIALLFFFFLDKEEFYRYGFYLAIGMSISLFICQIFPNGTDLRPVIDPNKNWAMKIVSSLYQADTNTNVFPSIHVYNAIGTNIALCKSKYFINNKIFKNISRFVMVLICMSTLFLKQHSVIDVAGGTVLSYLTYQLIYAKVMSRVTESSNAIA